MQHQLNTKNNKAIIFLIILGVLIFSYTATRAYLLSITWDEAYSYLNFVRPGKLFPEKFDHMSANNHLLNTWLDIFFVKCFGVSEFVLRIPSLIAHLLFLFYSAKLVLQFQNRWMVVAAFLILNFNPYLLDFFSLARGYGLSWGLMMASIYYLYLFISKEHRTVFAITSLVLSILATLANLVLLNYCLALYAVLSLLMFYPILKSKETSTKKIVLFLKNVSIPSILIVGFLGMITPYSLNLKDAGALFWGGHTGFWTDTISETINRNFYDVGFNIMIHWLLKGFMFLVLTAAIGFVGYKQFKKESNPENMFLGCILLITGFIALISSGLSYFFSTPFLTNRTALFFVVLFNLLFVFLMNELSKEKQKIRFAAYMVAFIMFFHFVFSFNLKYVLDWKFDADTKNIMTDMEKQIQSQQLQKQVKMGVSGLLMTSVEFYLAIKKNEQLKVEEINPLQPDTYDYLYLSASEAKKFQKKNTSTIKIYPYSRTVLLLNLHGGE